MFKLILTTLAGVGLVMTIGGRDFTDAELANLMEDDAPVVSRGHGLTTDIAATAVHQAAPEVQTEIQVAPQPASVAVQETRQLEVPSVLLASAVPTQPQKPTETAYDGVFVVAGNRVNVRSGPSTQHGVVGQVIRGDLALVVEETSNGWARIRIEGDGMEGYMAARFLEPAS